MSGEVVNLNKARKAKAKADAASRAQENRARFGLAKAEKVRRAAEAERRARELDGHEREKGE